MQAHEEARELNIKVNKIIEIFRDSTFRDMLNESEVIFRYEAIEGILLMVRNDISDMARDWQKEYEDSIT